MEQLLLLLLLLMRRNAIGNERWRRRSLGHRARRGRDREIGSMGTPHATHGRRRRFSCHHGTTIRDRWPIAVHLDPILFVRAPIRWRRV